MHKHARWSGMNVNSLRMDVKDVDAVELVTPFLEVICSGNTTGSVAAIALASIEKYLHYGILSVQNPNIASAMNTLISSASGCKFEASDAISDELVLLRILQVLEMALIGDCGQVLSDEAVCEIMESGLTMCCQKILSEMLRKSAEHSMINMIVAIFERLKKLDDGTSSSSAVHMNTPNATPSLDVNIRHMATESTESKNGKNTVINEDPTVSSANDSTEPPKPYGIPTIHELLRVLISLLNPHEHKHTDSMKMMALSLLNIALEVGGKSIGRFEILRTLITDEFCKYVFQLAKTDSVPLLSLSLRVIVTAFDTLGSYLKLQQELFLFFLIQKLSPPTGAASRNVTVDVDEEGRISFSAAKSDYSDGDSRSSSPMFLSRPVDKAGKSSAYTDRAVMTPEIREILLEYLLHFVRQETFMIDLWYNYDCDIPCGDLFEELIQFLCKNSFPDPHSYSTTNHHSLCLDTICMFIAQMAERSLNKDITSNISNESRKVEELLERKKRKRLILEGASRFNESPKKGIAFLLEMNVITADKNDDINKSLSHFLRSTQQLDKKALGEYLGRPENLDLLNVYMRQFDFKNKRMDEALRMVLETFRLPGESQQILRVTDTFAEAFFESGTPEIEDVDSAQVLGYSIIMLNTDQHSPQVRHQSRMSVDQYVRNLSGVNNKADFSRDYLESIYKAIQRDEILMPEEHEGLLGFNYAWKQLQHRSTITGLFERCSTSNYDHAMFKLVWKPLVAAVSCAFNTAQDDDTLERAITGFRHCATLAAHFGLCDAFDSIVVNLATTTGLLDNPSSPVPDPIVDVAGQKYVVSKLAVRFGRNYKGQLAAVVMFAVVTRHGNPLRKGWTKVLQIIRNLFLNSLLPNSMLIVEDFVSGTTDIPLKPKTPKPPRQQTRRDGSLLSTLSSYLLSPYSNDEVYSRDPTEEEVEMTMCAVDCVSACKLQELFIDITSLSLETQKSLLNAIRTVGYDSDALENSTETIEYDPAAVLFLEFMVTITIRNADRIQSLWPDATDYIFGILKFAEKQSSLVVERTVVGLLRLCICAASRKMMLEEILECLRLIRNFPPSVAQAAAQQTMTGVFNLSSANSEYIENTEFLNLVIEVKEKTLSYL
ncbi:GDP/GTP exchange factor for ARF [Rhizopus stolonifer]|uniref:GDP/GTP exchange factor for ARF n=1 Tax=Rhizopus stolonifer TaxID=4846 RepID=A0A367KSA9_RHIST|nr:GDP/GTP exchange factor for ARF [Rhizopus stolonifer]